MPESHKYKSCKDCPDRCAEPNCHSACAGYLYRTIKALPYKAQKAFETDIRTYTSDTVYKIKNRLNLRKGY